MKEEPNYSNSWRPMIGWVTLAQLVGYSGVASFCALTGVPIPDQAYEFMKWSLGFGVTMTTAYIAARSYDKKNNPKISLKELVKAAKE